MLKKLFDNSTSINLLKIMLTRKLIFVVVIVNVLYCFFNYYRFIQLNSLDKNIYDLILHAFSDFYYVFYVLSIIYLILIYNCFPLSNFNDYLIVKFDNRKEWFFANLESIMIITFLYIFSIICIYLLESMLSLSLHNEWSQYGLEEYGYINKQIKPFTLAFINVLFVYLYLLTLGIIFYISNIFLKSGILSFVVTLSINFFNILIYIDRVSEVYKYTFSCHVLISNNRFKTESLLDYMVGSIFYWFLIIIIIIYIGNSILKKIDMQWRDK